MNPRNFFIRLGAIAHKEVLHILRDRQVIYLALGMPLVLVLLFGYAVSFDVQNLKLAVVDQDQTPSSRRLLAAVANSGAFVLAQTLERPEQAENLFRQNKIRGALVIPAGFEKYLTRRQNATYQLLVDGANGSTTRVAVGYAQGISQMETIKLLRQSGVELRMPLDVRARAWFNPDMASAVFVVPGLVAVVLAIIAVLMSSLTVAREWERGSMEQLFSTPVGRFSVVLGKLLPYVGLGLMQFLLVLVAGAWLFDVPMRGSFLLLLGVTLLFLVCVLGQGLLISTATRNQQVATQIGAVSAILPSLMLSGFMFPIENMPLFLRLISHIAPARYMIVCLRGLLLKGHGVAELWPQLCGLSVLGLTIVGLSTVVFRRRLD